ncbi:hypothetical protein Dimus_002440 [Dionaea muscipula]
MTSSIGGGGGIRRHVAVCAFPFGTHAAPLLLLVRRIAAASPDVRFTFFNTDKSNAGLFKKAIDGGDDPVQNIVPCGVHDGVPEGHVFSGQPGEPLGLFLEAAEEKFRRSIAEAEEEVGMKISCLVSDAFLWFCQKIAEESGASWVALWTSGAASLSSHLHTDLIRSQFGVQGQEGIREDETVDFLAGFSAVRVSDLPDGVIAGDLDSPFSKMLHNMALVLPKAAAVAINSFEELQPEISSDMKTKLQNFLHIGPLQLTSPPPPPPPPPPRLDQTTTKSDDDEYGCLAWVEQQEPDSVVYISFGTVTTPPPDELVALAEGLEASGVAFIWSTVKANLPDGFVERTEEKGKGKFVPWAPQLALLGHPSVSAFVTHGGWNSITEAIIGGGVPMICRAFFGDQMLNRRMMESVWRIGVGVQGQKFTKDSIMGALENVMRSEQGKQMRQNLIALKQRAEEAAAQPDGSSIKDFESLIQIIAMPERS